MNIDTLVQSIAATAITGTAGWAFLQMWKCHSNKKALRAEVLQCRDRILDAVRPSELTRALADWKSLLMLHKKLLKKNAGAMRWTPSFGQNFGSP